MTTDCVYCSYVESAHVDLAFDALVSNCQRSSSTMARGVRRAGLLVDGVCGLQLFRAIVRGLLLLRQVCVRRNSLLFGSAFEVYCCYVLSAFEVYCCCCVSSAFNVQVYSSTAFEGYHGYVGTYNLSKAFQVCFYVGLELTQRRVTHRRRSWP